MIKKSTTVRMLILMLQAVCLFLVFSSVSNAAYIPPSLLGGGPPPPVPVQGGNKCPQGYKKCIQTCDATPLCAAYKVIHPVMGAAGYCVALGCPVPKLSQDQSVTIVQYALIPIQFIITYVAYIMGFFFMAWGIYRLRHGHEGGGFNQKHSGAGTALCFVAATMIFQYQWTTHMIGNSILGPATANMKGWQYSTTGALPLDPENLFGYVKAPNSKLKSMAVQDQASNGILQKDVWKTFTTSGQGGQSFWTLETLFAVLMVVGFISFLRGAMLLVKMGEGSGGGESSGTKAVVHIVAAGLLCNANHVTALINNLSGQINVTGQ